MTRDMEKHENRLYSYKMARATGFAPNPHFGVLTLATCKAGLRRVAPPGCWIAGWTSGSLAECPDPVGEERLVYLARVTKKLTYAEYWEQYPEKRPDVSCGDEDARYGDNIYEPDGLRPGGFILRPGEHDKTEEKKVKDLKGEYVLICEEFYYFNPARPLEVPVGIRPKVPKGQSGYGTITEDASQFIAYVAKNAERCIKTNNIISNN